jgi:hypothetical protein
MPKPTNAEEALANLANAKNSLTPLQYLYRLADLVSEEMADLSTSLLSDHEEIRAMAALELTDGQNVIEPTDYSKDIFVNNLVSLLSAASGLPQLRSLQRTLRYVSSDDEGTNYLHTLQLLAWLKTGQEKETFENWILIQSSKLAQLPTMIASKTFWTASKSRSTEIKEIINTGGGLRMGDDFVGNPVGMIFEVAGQLLADYTKLYELYQTMRRNKEDALLIAGGYRRKTSVSTKIGLNDWKSYNNALQAYRIYSAEMKSLQEASEEEKCTPAYMERMKKLMAGNKDTESNFHRYQMKIKTNPGKIQNAFGNYRGATQEAKGYAANELRLLKLAIQSRQKALDTVNQAIQLVMAMSKANCDYALATDRAGQEQAIKDFKDSLPEIRRGNFEMEVLPPETAAETVVEVKEPGKIQKLASLFSRKSETKALPV